MRVGSCARHPHVVEDERLPHDNRNSDVPELICRRCRRSRWTRFTTTALPSACDVSKPLLADLNRNGVAKVLETRLDCTVAGSQVRRANREQRVFALKSWSNSKSCGRPFVDSFESKIHEWTTRRLALQRED
jgi:hypothetical protein